MPHHALRLATILLAICSWLPSAEAPADEPDSEVAIEALEQSIRTLEDRLAEIKEQAAARRALEIEQTTAASEETAVTTVAGDAAPSGSDTASADTDTTDQETENVVDTAPLPRNETPAPEPERRRLQSHRNTFLYTFNASEPNWHKFAYERLWPGLPGWLDQRVAFRGDFLMQDLDGDRYHFSHMAYALTGGLALRLNSSDRHRWQVSSGGGFLRFDSPYKNEVKPVGIHTIGYRYHPWKNFFVTLEGVFVMHDPITYEEKTETIKEFDSDRFRLLVGFGVDF